MRDMMRSSLGCKEEVNPIQICICYDNIGEQRFVKDSRHEDIGFRCMP